MKKILSILIIFFSISALTLNETSCFCFNRGGGSSVSDIIKEITDATNICVKGSNLDPDTSNEFTKTNILNDIGINNSDQSDIELSGQLKDSTSTSITFTVTKKSETDSVVKDIKWLKISDDLVEQNIKASLWINQKKSMVATLHNGLYESDDNGDTFTKTTTWLEKPTTLLYSDKNNIYAGTSADGLYESDGISSTFNQVWWYTSNIESNNIKVIYQGSNGNIWLGTGKGIWMSTNGIDFEQKSTEGNNYDCLSLNEIDKTIYVGTRSDGLWKTDDNGNSFEQITNANIPTSDGVLSIEESGNILYVGTTKGLYQSTDNGDSFEQIDNSKIPNTDLVSAIYYDSGSKTTYIGSGHKSFYKTSDNINYENISYDDNEVANIEDINSVLFIGGDNNYDSIDTHNLWYYAI